MRVLLLSICAPVFLGAQDAPSFARDVATVLVANCIGCHAPSVKMGGLDMDSHESLLKGGQHGTVVVPGKSEESRLYWMITGRMQPRMPLDGKSLAAGEIEIIKKWIDSGARPPTPGEIKPLSQLLQSQVVDIKPKALVKPQIFSMAYRPDGKLLALGGHKEVRLVDPATGKTIATLRGHAQAVSAVSFSRDGQWLAAAGGLPARQGEVKIWNVEARTAAHTIQSHTDCIYAVAFSPDGKLLATASFDKFIKQWDVEPGQEVRTLKDHIDAVYALAFTPDGKRIVSGAADRSVKVWDAASGERLYTFTDPLDGLNTIALDPSGKRVAAAGLDKTIRVWGLGEKGGALVNTLIAHEDAILKVAYSPDGMTLISTAADNTIKVLKADDLAEIKTLENQPDWVLALEFAPDGKSFAAGRYDGSLSIYRTTDYRDLLEAFRASR